MGEEEGKARAVADLSPSHGCIGYRGEHRGPAGTIEIDANAFGAEAFAGWSESDFFLVGSSATNAGQRLIYDDASGWHYFDADGVGGASQIEIARLHAGLAITADDFWVTGNAA